MEYVAWGLLLLLLVVTFVGVYRLTKSQEEIDEELAEYVAQQLRRRDKEE